jgi:hypothetical protein
MDSVKLFFRQPLKQSHSFYNYLTPLYLREMKKIHFLILLCFLFSMNAFCTVLPQYGDGIDGSKTIGSGVTVHIDDTKAPVNRSLSVRTSTYEEFVLDTAVNPFFCQ